MRECGLRVAREEVAFLESTGGVTCEDMRRIRGTLLAPPLVKEEGTVSLKSILADAARSEGVNQLCRRVKPVLDASGVVTLKKHNAVHVLRADAQRVLDLALGLIL